MDETEVFQKRHEPHELAGGDGAHFSFAEAMENEGVMSRCASLMAACSIVSYFVRQFVAVIGLPGKMFDQKFAGLGNPVNDARGEL